MNMKKMKKMKKMFCMVLAGVITISMLACGGSKDDSADEQSTEQDTVQTDGDKSDENETVSGEIVFPLEETMEFTFFCSTMEQYELSDSLAFQAALERANISVDMTSVSVADAPEKASLLISSGEYPDVFFKPVRIDENTAKKAGAAIPLEDLIKEYAPNLCAILDERNAWGDLTDADGHIYSLPEICFQYFSNNQNVLWINQKWMENLGMETPTDMESLYEVLKAFAEQDADGDGDPNNELPFAKCGSGLEILLAYHEDFAYDDHYKAILTEDNSLEFLLNQDAYKEFLELCANMYKDGIIKEEFFTLSYDDAIASAKANNNVGCFATYAPNVMAANENAMDYIALYPFNEVGGLCDTGVEKGGLYITDKCENPEVIVAWADYFYCEEGARLADLGIEGVTYELFEDGTFKYILDNGEVFGKPKDIIQGGCTTPMVLSELRYHINAEEEPVTAYTYSQRHAVWNNGTIVPKALLTQEETDSVSDIWTEITAYTDNYAAEVVTGVSSLEDTWEDYVATLDAMGIEEVFGTYQTAWDRME